MASNPKEQLPLAVVLLNWKTPGMTAATAKRCLEVGYTLGEFALIIVDNASGDGSAALLRQEVPAAAVIESEVNLGFAGGVNLGVSAAMDRGFAAACLLNNDAEPASGCFDAIAKSLRNTPQCGAVGVTVRRTSDGTVEALGGGRLNRVIGTQKERFSSTEPLDFITGTCLTLRLAAVREVGLLDPAFFMYWEDIDISMRLRAAGWELCVASDAVVHHVGQGTVGASSPMARRYFLESMIRYFKKHSRFWIVPVASRLLRALAGRMIHADRDGVRLIMVTTRAAAMRGVDRQAPGSAESLPNTALQPKELEPGR
jgi:GT2 family glycosyltransferase